MSITSASALAAFIRRSPSCFHVIENFSSQLREAGYTELYEHERWELSPGGRYFLRRNGSSLIALRIPEKLRGGFMISAAHSDAPTFKLKDNPDRRSAGCALVSTEKYGGMLMSTWFDRPLSVAGRILVRKDGRVAAMLVDADRDLLVIPSLAIHMNRQANDGVKLAANVDTLPLYGSENAGSILDLLARSAGVSAGDILAHDLYLYCREEGRLLGADSEFILSPKLDDLMCAYGCMQGFLSADAGGSISVCCVLDNEEVGSETKQGAASSFLRDTLRRVSRALGQDAEDFSAMLARSFLISADNAHSRHPNHPEYSDAENFPSLNGGVVIKFNANQRYATDAVSAGLFRQICAKVNVPTQRYANRSDLAGGSTLGSIANTLLPVMTADIGLAQLAMHSAFETAGAHDLDHLIHALAAYFACTLTPDGMGGFSL